ncbi:MAG: cation transporting ATPase C-terminal domain-containing protein [Bryobacteraceae bacterium]
MKFEEGSLTLPLLPIQILWINLVTDGGPALALGLDPVQHDVMRMPPRPRHEPVITSGMWWDIVFTGALIAASTLFVLGTSLATDGRNVSRAQTMAFTTLMLSQMFNVFSARSGVQSAFLHLGQNRWLWLAVASSILAHWFVLYTPVLQKAFSTVPIHVKDWIFSAAVASTVLWAQEVKKLIRRSATA